MEGEIWVAYATLWRAWSGSVAQRKIAHKFAHEGDYLGYFFLQYTAFSVILAVYYPILYC